jgi:hypothetical protein
VGAARQLARAASRRSRWSFLVIAAVVAVGLGAALTSLDVARRTDRAFAEHLERARVGDLVVNPGPATVDAERAIDGLDGVDDVATDRLMLATVDNGAREVSPAVEFFLQVRSSDDGRYVERDVPAVHDGRLLGSGREAFLNRDAADEFGLGVGDEIRLSFYPAIADIAGITPERLASETAEIVGIGALHDEVIADELFPRPRVIVTPEVVEGLTCMFGGSDAIGDATTTEQILLAVIPPDCSMIYRYWSLDSGGDQAAQRVAEELGADLRVLNEDLPQALLDADVRYIVIPSFRADDEERVEQSLSPVVTSLLVFGAVAAVATVVVALLLAIRVVRRNDPDVATWRALGMGGGARTFALASPLLVTMALGVLGAVVLAWAASALGPIAGVRALVPQPQRSLSALVLLAAAAALLVLAGGVAVVARARAVRSRPAAPRARRGTWQAPTPALALGLRAATAGPGALAVLAGAAVAVAAITATLVFSGSLVRFVETPERYGWPFDAAALVNGGYGQVDADLVRATLDRPEVERFGLASLSVGIEIDGTTVPAIAARPGFEDVSPVRVVRGELPDAPDELALGERTARELDVAIGDRVTLTSTYGSLEVVVVGTAVLPSLGPLESDRTSLGTGAYLPAPLLEAMLAEDAAASAMPLGDFADFTAGFVAMDLAGGVDADAFFAEIAEEVDGWDSITTTPITLSQPVRPATVVDVAAARNVPFLLAGALVAAMVASIATGVAAGTRARRHELAVLRAVGASPRQVRRSVRVHALVVVAVALVAGLPLGVAGGRLAFGAFALDLGAEPDASVPLLLLAAIGVALVVVGLLVAVLPQRAATRHSVLAALAADDGTVALAR